MLHLVTGPICNLDFISKILERLFLARIQPHITSSPSFNQYQSAYRRHHSTETSILHTLDNILLSSDSGKSIHNVDRQRYPDDTQLLIFSLSPSDVHIPDLDNLTRCIDSLHVWFFT